jgi:putative peptide zinc metalloprotease protein
MFMRIKPILKSLVPFTKTEDSVNELKPWARVAVTVYVLTLVPALAFMLGLTVLNMPRIFATAYDSFMLTAHKLGHAGGISIVVDVIQLLVLLLVPLGIVITLAQLGRKVLTGAWGVTEGRPAMRGALVAFSGAAAAFAAYTWAPAAVYRPIQPQERGTVVGAVGEIKAIPTGRPALPEKRARELGGAPLRSKQPGTGTPKPTKSGGTTTPGTTTKTSTTPAATTPAATTPTVATSTTTTPASTSRQPTATATTPVQTATTSPTATATTTTTAP